MSKAEKFIQEYTKNCSNDIVGWYDNGLPIYASWLTPDEARKAVEIAREETIDKVIGWIEEINNRHYIMRYSDSCEPFISELIDWFKNYMKEGGKDE